jgi:hypothetical protein
MPYEVTHAAAGVAEGQPGIDKGLTLIEALNLACRLIVAGRQDVTIKDERDESGKTAISGKDLAACCRGEKILTNNLRAK